MLTMEDVFRAAIEAGAAADSNYPHEGCGLIRISASYFDCGNEVGIVVEHDRVKPFGLRYKRSCTAQEVKADIAARLAA